MEFLVLNLEAETCFVRCADTKINGCIVTWDAVLERVPIVVCVFFVTINVVQNTAVDTNSNVFLGLCVHGRNCRNKQQRNQ